MCVMCSPQCRFGATCNYEHVASPGVYVCHPHVTVATRMISAIVGQPQAAPQQVAADGNSLADGQEYHPRDSRSGDINPYSVDYNRGVKRSFGFSPPYRAHV